MKIIERMAGWRILRVTKFALALAGSLLARTVVADEGFSLVHFFEHDVHVITVTDMTQAGRLLREPSRAHPVYYEALVYGYTDFGDSVAGIAPPDKTAMLKLMLKLMADRGYYPAVKKHPPEMVIVLRWGTMNGNAGMALPFLGGDKLDLMWELEPLSITNTMQYRNSTVRSQDADLVSRVAHENLYVLVIQAYDETAALAGKTLLLWQTKVGVPAVGLDLSPTLKQMAREAAPFIGRETAKPVVMTAPPPEGQVNLGELKIIESIDPSKLPITDATDDEKTPVARAKH